jgi:hypothetical protein
MKFLPTRLFWDIATILAMAAVNVSIVAFVIYLFIRG